LKHMFKKKKTIKYPEETRVFAPVYRGQHVLKRDEFIYGKEILVESMENRIDITKRQNTGKRGAV